MRPVLATLMAAWIAVACWRQSYPSPGGPGPGTRPPTQTRPVIDPEALRRWVELDAAARREGRPSPPLPPVYIEIDLRDWLPALRGEPTTRKGRE